jgi:cation transport regulator ChaC
MWIFGYGSLIFRPGFPFLERRAAYVAGYMRRFWQGSPDHRGTPGAPGRVVTLLASPGNVCGGAAFRIDPVNADPILAQLDEREIAGFERVQLPLFDRLVGGTDRLVGGTDRAHGVGFGEGITWIASDANPHFLGPLPEDEIAAHVRRSHGPSGANLDYVLELAAALRELGIDDPHVEAVARAI